MLVFKCISDCTSLISGEVYVGGVSSFTDSSVSLKWVVDSKGNKNSNGGMEITLYDDDIEILFGGISLGYSYNNEFGNVLNQLITICSNIERSIQNDNNQSMSFQSSMDQISVALNGISSTLGIIINERNENIDKEVNKRVDEIKKKISEKYHDVDESFFTIETSPDEGKSN